MVLVCWALVVSTWRGGHRTEFPDLLCTHLCELFLCISSQRRDKEIFMSDDFFSTL